MINTTLVIAVFNGAKTLNAALDSVAKQTLAIDQVIIINDGSTDGTLEIINEWKNRLPLTIIDNLINQGLTKCLQIGLKNALGDIVFRLDADDIWLPRHVEMLVDLAIINPSAVLFASRAEIRDENGKLVGYSSINKDKNIRAKLLWDNPLVHSAVAFNRNAYNMVGGYRSSTFALDYELWIKLLKYGAFICTEEVNVTYQIFNGSLSRIKKQKSLQIRLEIQLFAIKSFIKVHPLVSLIVLPILLIRKFLNNINWK